MDKGDPWDKGDPYERFMGRWSRPVGQAFVHWLELPRDLRWLDIGCGTGALTRAILDTCRPAAVLGIDQSEAFVRQARQHVPDTRAQFEVGDALHLSPPDNSTDVVVSGLMLNFIPDPAAALAEMKRVVKPGGVIAVYLWDYAGEMQFLRHFWDAVVKLNPKAVSQDEGVRFPLCRPRPLEGLFRDAGLHDVGVEALEVATVFQDFDDFWSPFLGEVGPAPGYVASLTSLERRQLRDQLQETLPNGSGGEIKLTARAWAAKGRLSEDM